MLLKSVPEGLLLFPEHTWIPRKIRTAMMPRRPPATPPRPRLNRPGPPPDDPELPLRSFTGEVSSLAASLNFTRNQVPVAEAINRIQVRPPRAGRPQMRLRVVRCGTAPGVPAHWAYLPNGQVVVMLADMSMPGLREQKKTSTRLALIEKALELAEEREYDGFTITDIVEQVGVSRRTFSNYFAGKAECLVAVGDPWMDAALELIAQTDRGVPLTDLLHQVLMSLVDQIVDTRTGFLTMVAGEPELAAAMAARDAQRAQRIAVVLADRLGLPTDDLRLLLLSEFCLSAGGACIRRWTGNGRTGGRDGLFADLDLAFSLIDFSGLQDSKT